MRESATDVEWLTWSMKYLPSNLYLTVAAIYSILSAISLSDGTSECVELYIMPSFPG